MSEFKSKSLDKPIEEYTEAEIKEMFIELFFWIANNRLSWLQECIARRKAELRSRKWKRRECHEQRYESSNNNIP